MKHYRNNILGINSCYGAILGPIIHALDNKGIRIELATGGFFADTTQRNSIIKITSCFST